MAARTGQQTSAPQGSAAKDSTTEDRSAQDTSAQDSSAPDSAPAALPRLAYRLLTGSDDRAFCERISTALAEGYVLYGSPSVAVRGGIVVCAQAVVLPVALPGAGQGGLAPAAPEGTPR